MFWWAKPFSPWWYNISCLTWVYLILKLSLCFSSSVFYEFVSKCLPMHVRIVFLFLWIIQKKPFKVFLIGCEKSRNLIWVYFLLFRLIMLASLKLNGSPRPRGAFLHYNLCWENFIFFLQKDWWTDTHFYLCQQIWDEFCCKCFRNLYYDRVNVALAGKSGTWC